MLNTTAMFAQHIRWLPAVVLQYVAPAAVRPLLLALGSMAEQGPYLNWIDLEATLLLLLHEVGLLLLELLLLLNGSNNA